MRIFIIGGKSGSGKTYLASLIKEYYDLEGDKSIVTEYSKYIKLYAKEMINWDYSEPKPRKFLQEMGEMIREKIDDKFIINRMIEEINIYKRFYQNIIISDARYIDEFETIKEKYPDTYTIHLLTNKRNKLTREEKNHISETSLDNYDKSDYTIKNNNLDELKKEIKEILEEIE